MLLRSLHPRRATPALVWLGLCLPLCVGLAACTSVTEDSATTASSPGSVRQSIGNLEVQGVPPLPESVTARVRQYSNARSAAFAGFVGDDMLINTRFGQTGQVHRLSQPGAARAQLTFFAEPVGSVTAPPVAQPEGFIFGRDIGGAEFYQLFWFDFESGRSRLLTDGRSRYGNVLWNREGTRFAYSTTERDGVRHDVHSTNLRGERRIIHESDDGLWVPLDFAPGGERLLLLKYLSITRSELYEADLATGALTRLLADREPVAFGGAVYSGDGRSVVVLADLDAEFAALHRLQLADGTVTALGPQRAFGVEDMTLAPDGVTLAYTVNEDGLSRLYLRDLLSGDERAMASVPAGIIRSLRFDPSGTRLGFTLYEPTAPGEAYSLALADETLARWTFSETGGLPAAQFVAPELVRYPTFDQVDGAPRQIPAFYFRPPTAAGSAASPVPVIVLIHGGPEAQYRPYFSSTVQYLTGELGYAVIAPNVRGSAGYGKSYLKLDNGLLREDSVRDIGALLDWIETRPELDAQRVVVYGGSYGGYMVLASLARYGERLAAGIEAVGISNFVTFLENTQPYRVDLRRVEYGDERDPQMRAFLEQISPLNATARMSKPLMILQGANDPRVPASESEQILAALEKRQVPVWYVLARDEGHGFRKKRNREYQLGAMGLFLERFVGPAR
ncbi:MAG: alpha/beta fold hydrolase [Pseudomonadota bacterium]